MKDRANTYLAIALTTYCNYQCFYCKEGGESILKLASSGKALGLITREYIDKKDYEKFNLVEVETSVELGEIEFGIYISSNKFKELNNLIKLIKRYFNYNTNFKIYC